MAVALIAAAGTGERFGADLPKTLVEFLGKPVIVHTLERFEQVRDIEGIILVVHPDYEDDYRYVIDRYGLKKVRAVVQGGKTRTQSVRNGLRALKGSEDYVFVHDGARPLVSNELIERGLAAVRAHPAVIAAVPVKPTLKVVDPGSSKVRETLDRTLVWEIQTPQIFECELLKRAYAGDDEATDDAALVERLGADVKVFMGDYRNIKITTPEDLVIAKVLLEPGGAGDPGKKGER